MFLSLMKTVVVLELADLVLVQSFGSVQYNAARNDFSVSYFYRLILMMY